MPRVKLSLWKNPKDLNPAPKFQIAGQVGQMLSVDEHFAQRLSMLKAAEKFLSRRLKEPPDPVAMIVLLGDLFDVALSPDIMTDPDRKAPARVLQMFARYPDFTLEYLMTLRKAAANTSLLHKAIAALRTRRQIKHYRRMIPIAEASDKEISADCGLPVDTVKAARQQLAKLDSARWEAAKGKRTA